MFEAIYKRWKFILGLDEGFTLPNDNLLKMHPDDIPDSEWKKLKEEIGTYPSFATVKKFIYEVSPFTVNEGNKDQYLNNCIEDMYLQIEAKIQEKVDTVAAIKLNIDKLVEEGSEDEEMEPI